MQRNMSKLTKTLLVLSCIGLVSGLIFVTGLVNVGNLSFLYVALPSGAIFFGLFLISKLLEKEVALHDAEIQAAVLAATRAQGPAVLATKENSRGSSELICAKA